VKRSGRDEPTQVVIYMCMETTLAISLYFKLAKALFFLLSHVFSSTRGQNRFCLEGRGQGERGSPNNVYTCK
jgi:hypothetical protein